MSGLTYGEMTRTRDGRREILRVRVSHGVIVAAVLADPEGQVMHWTSCPRPLAEAAYARDRAKWGTRS